jgi:hypothetical protein
MPDAPLCWSLCHLAEGAYTIRLLFVSVSVMCEFTQDSWKMYRYTLEKRVFIVRERTGKDCPKYGAPGSILSARNGGHFQRISWCLHISHTTNVLLFKFHCNIIIGVRIIKERAGLVGSGTPWFSKKQNNTAPTFYTLNTSDTYSFTTSGTFSSIYRPNPQ